MTTGDQDPRAELTDEQLDALLKSADQELLEYIQARTDPTAVLAQVMASSGAGRDTLPLRNPTFTGRTSALQDLERRLVAHDPSGHLPGKEMIAATI